MNNDKAKPDTVKGLGEVVAESDRVPEGKTEAKTEVRTNSQPSPNRTIQFHQTQDRGRLQGLSHLGQLQHLVGALQDSRPARGGGSSR
jgi:hypothetical protein